MHALSVVGVWVFERPSSFRREIVTSDISRIDSMGWEAVVGRDVNEVGAAESAAAVIEEAVRHAVAEVSLVREQPPAFSELKEENSMTAHTVLSTKATVRSGYPISSHVCVIAQQQRCRE
jgi:hypothetical protein